jgi:hypothetical protein
MPTYRHVALHREDARLVIELLGDVLSSAVLAWRCPRSTLAQWVAAAAWSCSRWWTQREPSCWDSACSMPTNRALAMLDPGAGKTHRAYLWTYCSTALQSIKLVVSDFAESRAGRHPADFSGPPRWTFLARHAGVRRLLGLQGLLRQRRDRSWLPCPCQALVPRAVGGPQKVRPRGGARAVRRTV